MIQKALFGGLFADRSFRFLIASTTVAGFATEITKLALPIVAALMLNATPVQMGILLALETLPFALISLPAGVWIDRMRQRPVLFLSNGTRALVLLLIPLAAWLGVLSMGWVYFAGFVIGVDAVIGGAAYQVLQTRLVGRERLVEANAKMALVESSASIMGPGMAGGLIHALTAPVALVVDALAFVAAMLLLKTVREPEMKQPREPSHWLDDMKEGLRYCWNQPVLRALAWTFAIWQFVFNMLWAIIILFATRTLSMSAGAVGLSFAAAGIGTLMASIVVERLVKRLGLGRVIVLAIGGCALMFFCLTAIPGIAAALGLLPAAEGKAPWGVTGLFALAQWGLGFTITTIFVSVLSLRQSVTPEIMLGRMTATMRALMVTPAPFGALLGGVLGKYAGLTATTAIAGVAMLALAFIAFRYTPLGRRKGVLSDSGVASARTAPAD